MSTIFSIDMPELPMTGSSGIKKTQVKNARKYWKEYCENSSIYGFKYLAQKRSRFETCFWILFIVISFTACSYQIRLCYTEYEDDPVIFSLSIKEAPISAIPFPAVTICPLPKFRIPTFKFSNVYNKTRDENTTINPNDELTNQYMTLSCDGELFPQNETFTDEYFNIIDEMKLPWYTLQDCSFMGYSVDCGDIFTPIILDEGICFSFNMLDREEIFREEVVHYTDYHRSRNGGQWSMDIGYLEISKHNNSYPRRALHSGADNALDVTLFQYQPNNDFNCIMDVQGYSVSLHNPDSIPSPKKQHFQVQFDSAALVAVQPKMSTSAEVKMLHPQSRKCYYSHERLLRYFKIYTPENCRLECLTDYTLKYCGCVNFYMPRNESTPICGKGYWKCMHKAERELYNLQLVMSGAEIAFFCNCPPSCTELTYDVEQSQIEWNWREQLQEKDPDLDEILLNKPSLSKLSVFIKREQFLVTQKNEIQSAKQVLANFGGLLSLFTGFSLLSVVEIIYFLTLKLCY